MAIEIHWFLKKPLYSSGPASCCWMIRILRGTSPQSVLCRKAPVTSFPAWWPGRPAPSAHLVNQQPYRHAAASISCGVRQILTLLFFECYQPIITAKSTAPLPLNSTIFRSEFGLLVLATMNNFPIAFWLQQICPILQSSKSSSPCYLKFVSSNYS